MTKRPLSVACTAQGNVYHVNTRGHQVLNIPLLNRGSAFTEDQRRQLGLEGLLPSAVESLEEQAARAC